MPLHSEVFLACFDGPAPGRIVSLTAVGAAKPPTHLDVVLNWTTQVKPKLDAAKP